MPPIDGISLCIPTYNRAGPLRGTLASIARLTIPPGVLLEVLVINNNCTDNTPSVVRECASSCPWPVRLSEERESGADRARNRILREARYDHIVFFDDDVEVAKDWIIGYLDAVNQLHPDALVGPVHPLFEEDPPAYVTPAILESVTSLYSRKGDKTLVLPRDTAHEIPGCNFAVSRQAAIEIGGFDVTLDRVRKGMIAGGDFDFGRRLVASGKKVVYEPRCSIKHLISAEKLSKRNLRLRWYGVGIYRAIADRKQGAPSPVSRRIRTALGAARLGARALCAGALGRTAAALELRLRAIEAIGYLRTR